MKSKNVVYPGSVYLKLYHRHYRGRPRPLTRRGTFITITTLSIIMISIIYHGVL